MIDIMGRKIVKAKLSVRPGKVTVALIELDSGVVLYGEMRIVHKSQGVCVKCGELVPQGTCSCGPRQRLVTLDFSVEAPK